ncbi:hypothetical protein ACS0TY_027753 [Phlomoides rotata]
MNILSSSPSSSSKFTLFSQSQNSKFHHFIVPLKPPHSLSLSSNRFLLSAQSHDSSSTPVLQEKSQNSSSSSHEEMDDGDDLDEEIIKAKKSLEELLVVRRPIMEFSDEEEKDGANLGIDKGLSRFVKKMPIFLPKKFFKKSPRIHHHHHRRKWTVEIIKAKKSLEELIVVRRPIMEFSGEEEKEKYGANLGIDKASSGEKPLLVNLDLALYKAKILARNYRFEEAQEILKKCINYWPEYGRPYVALGKALSKQSKMNDARAVYGKGCQATQGENSYIWQAILRKQGIFLEKDLNFVEETTRKLMKVWHAVNPRDPVLLQSLALLEYKYSTPNLTRQLFRTGSQLDPRHQPVWIAWGWMEWKEGKLDTARELYQKAVSIDSTSESAARCLQVCSIKIVLSAWGVLEQRVGNLAINSKKTEMDSPTDQVLGDCMTENEATEMDMELANVVEEEDPFLIFIDYAKSILYENSGEEEDSVRSPSWSWIANSILRTCISYSSGVTPAILLSELSLAWNEQNRSGAPKKQSDFIAKLKKKHKRAKLPNTITIDSIYEKKFLSLSSVIEAVILDAFILPGTNIYMLTLGDIWSSNTIDLYLHRRFYNIADPKNGILKKGREVLLTGCYLRVSAGSSGCARLLPTEYFVVLLDEDEDDDPVLIRVQFCSDSFSSISLDAVNVGASYYARIEDIGPLEVHGANGNLKRKQITLVDNDGVTLNFSLWGEQVSLANLFSVGSMLALDRPFISSGTDNSLEIGSEIRLEYGSETQLYMVPHIPHNEQVSIPLTQNHCQGSKLLTASNLSQRLTVSQVTLPCDSQGSIDFSNYPFRSYIIDVRDKMTGISLHGTVADIRTSSEGKFSLTIDDTTGSIWAKLHFVKSWSLGRLGIGHTVFLSGLSSSPTRGKGLELSWYENGSGSSFFNLSCLPAFLNTSCLHKLSCLSDLSIHTTGARVCRVWVDQMEHCDVRVMHRLCGHLINEAPNGNLECKFCHTICNAEAERTFLLQIIIADDTSKIFAWCIGQTAAELLQISPDEFCELPEEEQMMYPSSVEHEKFIVGIVKCGRRKEGCGGSVDQIHSMVDWEVTRAVKYESTWDE